MYRALGLYVWKLYGERNYLGAGRVGDEHGAILSVICSFVRSRSNHSAKWQIGTTPPLLMSGRMPFSTGCADSLDKHLL
jgi:hypothetical protein